MVFGIARDCFFKLGANIRNMACGISGKDAVGDDGAARVFCDVCTPDRKPFAGDPRECLRRMFYRAEERGYLLNVGAELEYYYFPDDHTPEPLDEVGYFDLTEAKAGLYNGYRRSLCIDRLYYKKNGEMERVRMTSEGLW